MKIRRVYSLLLIAGFVLASGHLGASSDCHSVEAFKRDIADKVALATKQGTGVIQGKDSWLFLASELSALDSGPFWGEQNAAKGPLPAILDFDRQLKSAGIQLILVPVPGKATIYPDKISDCMSEDWATQRVDTVSHDFYKELSEKGIVVIDLAPVFLEDRCKDDSLLYCKHDTHWTSRACEITAQLIAEKIKDSSWLKEIPRDKFVHKTQRVEVTGDLYCMLGNLKLPKERLLLHTVQDQGARTVPDTWRESPVLLMGDSHTLIFHSGGDMLAIGAGLADHLAFELGFPVDLIGVRGSGGTASRINLLRRADSLAGKKVVIWCFSFREFVEGQSWRNIELIK